MMAYITLEDDTGSMELLAFSNILSQYGGYLKENSPLVVVGRFSVREDKEPQMVVNGVRLLTSLTEQAQETPKERRLYLRLASEQAPEYRKVRAIANMFPGNELMSLYFADTKLRRGTRCSLEADLLQELTELLGTENVVVK